MFMHEPGRKTALTKSHTHACAVCEQQIPQQMLMCGPHWRLVPPQQQLTVYRLWNQLHRAPTRSKAYERIWAEYLQARDAAIESVRKSLGETPTADPGHPEGA
ncbi:hypothetical protein [Caldimonas sp. KR1-144]|uniref:hypothetical protein n=1 Tax=Caldimonas sp. KR1-144 TaxID=3400911 RepID=UPI003C1001E3